MDNITLAPVLLKKMTKEQAENKGNYDHCHSRIRQIFHNVENLADHFGVKCGSRLIEKHY